MSGVWVAYASAIPARKGDREAGAHTAGGSPERLLKARTLFSATITSTCLPTPQRASLWTGCEQARAVVGHNLRAVRRASVGSGRRRACMRAGAYGALTAINASAHREAATLRNGGLFKSLGADHHPSGAQVFYQPPAYQPRISLIRVRPALEDRIRPYQPDKTRIRAFLIYE